MTEFLLSLAGILPQEWRGSSVWCILDSVSFTQAESLLDGLGRVPSVAESLIWVVHASLLHLLFGQIPVFFFEVSLTRSLTKLMAH
jgi:hypothetical protein